MSTIGLPYMRPQWQVIWLAVMRNVAGLIHLSYQKPYICCTTRELASYSTTQKANHQSVCWPWVCAPTSVHTFQTLAQRTFIIELHDDHVSHHVQYPLAQYMFTSMYRNLHVIITLWHTCDLVFDTYWTALIKWSYQKRYIYTFFSGYDYTLC